MLFQNITILDEAFQTKENMYVGIEKGRIDYLGDKAPDKDYGERYDGAGKLLMPGFYNSHAHSPMMLLRGYGENLSLQDWLFTKIFPFEAKLTGDAVYHATMLAMAESLRFGIVSSTDMYYFCEDMAKAVLESKTKANISRSIAHSEDKPVSETPAYAEMVQLVKNFHNAGEERVKIDISLHAEYTNNVESIKSVCEYMKDTGLNMHVHVSETKLEHEECKERHGGMTPVQLLNSHGAFDTNATAAHCVWIEEEDMEIFKEKGVTVASCPVSNLKLASGVCNVPELLKRGVSVSIGTDSVASNNSLNFIEEMKIFALLNKERRNDPTLITPPQTLYAGTVAGAKAQGRRDCGSLKVGNKADVIVLKINSPHMRPVHNLLTNLIYSASGSDVVLTMVDGEVLYKDGDFMTIDIERALYEVENTCKNILKQL